MNFKEPDSGLPLKCDMCEGEDEPLCVKWCINDALVYEEREEETEEDELEALEEMELGLEVLADKFGLEKIKRAVTRMREKEQ
jgi:benzoyl-CoA reductase subunit BamC